MLVTESFVFLHIPKTGGSFIQTVLPQHLRVVDHKALLRRQDPDQRIWTHAPFSGLPARWRRLPTVCVIRNPWDWYVSWFAYESARGPRRRQPLGDQAADWQRALRTGRADFKEVVTHLCHGDVDHPLGPVMRAEGLDFYSALVRSIAGEALALPQFTPLRFERLRRQLVRFLREQDALTPGLRAAIRRAPPKKRSEHGPYANYYDDELAQLVGDKTSWLCERFGYSFESPTSSRSAS